MSSDDNRAGREFGRPGPEPEPESFAGAGREAGQ